MATSSSTTNTNIYNPNIVKVIRRKEVGKREDMVIVVSNCANADRDELLGTPFGARSDEYINSLANDLPNKPHILVILEAGRESQGKTWEEYAFKICLHTGLSVFGCYRTNATSKSFGKLVLYDRSRVAIKSVQQLWMREKHLQQEWGGDYFGFDSLVISAYPVDPSDRKIIMDDEISPDYKTIMVTHFPTKRDDRLRASKIVAWQAHSYHADVVMGDINTFMGEGGEEQLQDFYDKGFRELLPEGTKTFFAFEKDTIPVKDKETLDKYHSESKVIEEKEDGSFVVLPVSWLDHVLIRNRSYDPDTLFPASASAIPIKGTDHYAIEAILPF